MSVNTPIVNDGILYCNGLKLDWVSTTVIHVGPGQCRNNSNANDIILNDVTAINAATTGPGGLDTGTLGNDTLYAVYALGDSTLYNANSCIMSADFDAPEIPYGYDMYRYIGCVLTDGSAHILQFVQTGEDQARWMWYSNAIQVLNNGSSATFAAIDLSASMPAIQTEVMVNVEWTPAGAGDEVGLRATGSASTDGQVILTGAVASVAQRLNVELPCDDTASIDYKAHAAGNLDVYLVAYQDLLV